jgi:hypothetical protein
LFWRRRTLLLPRRRRGRVEHIKHSIYIIIDFNSIELHIYTL